MNSASLIFAEQDPRLIRPVLNSSSIKFYNLILNKYLYSSRFKFTLKSEGENNIGAKFSLYTVIQLAQF